MAKKADIFGMGTDTVKDYADFFSKNDVTELHLELNGLTLTMKRNVGQTVQTVVHTPVTAAPAAAPAAIREEVKPAAPVDDDSKYQKIASPIVGTFYAASSPDTPPYVKVGDVVNENTVVCIVEAMKMMNELKAGVKGRIHKILMTNGQPVAQNQTLFLVDKA
ncbi:MAG: acetyl-CoA carboxylase biotin carboxyl carrier protein [Spirochaetota bacterium]